MVKLLVLAILLASSPATGLLEKLFRIENTCYLSCASHYIASRDHLRACKTGCDFHLHKEDCTNQCVLYSTDKDFQESCKLGCTLTHTDDKESSEEVVTTPVVAPATESSTPAAAEPERPRSIILIRLRQRPMMPMDSMPMQSMHHLLSNDPMQMFNEMIKQFQERTKFFEDSIRKTFEENAQEVPKLPVLEKIPELPKSIPLIRIPISNLDSSNEEKDDRRPMMGGFRHGFHHRFGGHHQFESEPIEQKQNRLHQFVSDVRTEWNDLIRRQPKIPIWIFLAIFLTSSVILWYMVMSLCHQTPSRDILSIRAQELVFHPYDYEKFGKEKIQPEDQPYEVTESLPIKFSNI